MTWRRGAILAVCQSSSWCPQPCWPALALYQAWWCMIETLYPLVICSALYLFSYKGIPWVQRCVQTLEVAGETFCKCLGRVSGKSTPSRKGHPLPRTYADLQSRQIIFLYIVERTQCRLFYTEAGWCPQGMVPLPTTSTGLCCWHTDHLAMVRTI